MGLFSKKKKETDNEENSVNAIEVVVSPPEDVGGPIMMAHDYLCNILLNQIVERGQEIRVREHRTREKRASGAAKGLKSKGVGDSTGSFHRFYVVDTKPSGRVRIVKETKIKHLSEFPDTTDGIPKSKVLAVKKLPSLDKLTELKDIEEMIKIATSGNFINKYEDENQTVYFSGNYFFKKKK